MNKNVFINCPFDKEYWPLLRVLVFCVAFLGYRPRLALESSDSSLARIDKIASIIADCRYGIHDLSRLQSGAAGEYYRLNMPFELGLDFGSKKYGALKYSKCILVLSKERYQYQRALSDLAGCDIKHHNNEPMELIQAVREWFVENTSSRTLPGPTAIWNRFNDFMYDLYLKCEALGFSEDDFERLTFAEFITYSKEWIDAET